jgi:hypothetical protein
LGQPGVFSPGRSLHGVSLLPQSVSGRNISTSLLPSVYSNQDPNSLTSGI